MYLSKVVEPDAVVSDAEPELGRIDILKPLQVVLAGDRRGSKGRGSKKGSKEGIEGDSLT